MTKTKFGNIIIRERKGKYYVYILETVNGDVRETYVGPLIDVVTTYRKLKDENGGGRSDPQRRGRDSDPRGVEPHWLSRPTP